MKYFMMVGLMVFSLGANASVCKSLSEYAEQVMIKRQEGFQMERVYAIADGEPFESIVIDAYEHPNYQTNEYKNQAVNEFASKWFRLCLEAMKE